MPARFSRITAATLSATAFAALHLVSCSDSRQPPTPTAPTQNSGTRSPAPEPTRHIGVALADLFLLRTLTPRFSFEIAAGGERSIYVLLWFAAPQAETLTLKTSFDRS